jgi:hypothetical protein
MKILNKSISELEGWKWKGNIPNEDESYVEINFFRLHTKPVNEMDFLDIRFLIGQNSGLKYLIPIAFEELKKDLFVETEYYPGDLFCSLLLVNDDPNYWSINPLEKQELISLYNSQKQLLRTLDIPDEIKSKIKEAYKEFLKK